MGALEFADSRVSRYRLLHIDAIPQLNERCHLKLFHTCWTDHSLIYLHQQTGLMNGIFGKVTPVEIACNVPSKFKFRAIEYLHHITTVICNMYIDIYKYNSKFINLHSPCWQPGSARQSFRICTNVFRAPLASSSNHPLGSSIHRVQLV
jgi:hypothetical protein